MRPTIPLVLRALPLACLLAGLGGCDVPSLPVASSLPPPPSISDPGALRAYADALAPRYAANPEDRAVALHYAAALRGLTEHAQAVAVLQRLAVKYPHDMIVLGAYGKALADAGRLQEAQAVLERAHTPDRPNWTILSAQGSVADQMGDHAGAQRYYEAALKIVPDQPKVLSNLGLSYALEHRWALAEDTLRRAAAQPRSDARVRQNLALVLASEGKYAEAEEVSRRDLSPIDAAENVAVMKRLAGGPGGLASLGGGDGDTASPKRLAAASRSRAARLASDEPSDPVRTAAVEDDNR